jgi:uncharacterized protein YacL
MTLFFLRLFFVIVCALAGFQLGASLSSLGQNLPLVGMIVGIGGSLLVILLEIGMRRVSTTGLSAAVFGLIFGLIMSNLVSYALSLVPMAETILSSLRVIFLLIFCYLGMVIAMRGRDEFSLVIPYIKLSRQDAGSNFIILDTSVIIDGRIVDISKTRFIEGKLIVPRFVLRELQHIADSKDSLKRNRGRRGLDILAKLQKDSNLDVKIHDDDYPDLEVDAKLIKLAKILDAKIFTNDFNLSKIAELQGVKVLNVNELANALKTVVLPGELLGIRVIKEGKERNQGVGYLEDGTMVVVENGRHLIGQRINTVVTSVLQTAAGRMIFTKLESNEAKTRAKK